MSSNEKLTIKHDGLLDIATANSRNAPIWKNLQIHWSELVAKYSKPHKTHATRSESVKWDKRKLAEIKDVGGYVGGYLTSGRRKAVNVLHKQLMTLDVDFANTDFINDLFLLFGCAFFVHSTYSHTPDKPRYRLIMPLDRPVRPDEYEAIARRIAGNINIELFDSTTFQPERLMFWPSIPKDADYDFEFQDGPWLDADDILNSYVDWTDSSEWPVSNKTNDLIQKVAKKQGDPLEKPGLIGAFCRTHDIYKVIEEILNEVYEPCAIENRYTYKEGSTAAGLVVYDDGKYAYSNHGTDPISGKLCNAFDLVRLHMFGHLDQDVREGTPGNKLPSFTAMQEYASKIPAVVKMMVSEKQAEAIEDFAGIELEEERNDDWKEKFKINKNGQPFQTIENILLVLLNDPFYKNIGYDDFAKYEAAKGPLPWRKVTRNTRRITDKDVSIILNYLEKTYELNSELKVRHALSILSAIRGFHPVCDYLNIQIWDGIKRLENLFIDYLGAADTVYTRQVTCKSFVAAVARVFEPGIKFDYMPVLVGEQGIGKSSILAKLGGDWFSDSFNFSMLHTKEAVEQIQGVWINEVGEMAGSKKAEVEGLKHYLTKCEDIFRPAYGRRTETFPRQCIFFGTTNNLDFLIDQTGNRRFWPISCHVIEPIKNHFKDLDKHLIDQLWAEAVYLYKKGEKLYLTKEMEAEARSIQAKHTEQDERFGAIEKYINTLLPHDWEDMDIRQRREYLANENSIQEVGTIPKTRVCAAEIWCEVFCEKLSTLTPNCTKPIHSMLKKLKGWKKVKQKRFKNYGTHIAYELEIDDKAKSVTAKTENVTAGSNGVLKNVTAVTAN